MSTLRVSSVPCQYERGFIQVILGQPGIENTSELFEVKNVAQCDAALDAVRAKLVGLNAYIFAKVVAGRKPNGFDKWHDSVRARRQVEKAAP